MRVSRMTGFQASSLIVAMATTLGAIGCGSEKPNDVVKAPPGAWPAPPQNAPSPTSPSPTSPPPTSPPPTSPPPTSPPSPVAPDPLRPAPASPSVEPSAPSRPTSPDNTTYDGPGAAAAAKPTATPVAAGDGEPNADPSRATNPLRPNTPTSAPPATTPPVPSPGAPRKEPREKLPMAPLVRPQNTLAAPPPAATTPAAPSTAKTSKSYEPLFENWPQPEFVLVLTGRQNGYIEPCGCTGLANQKGGMARRMTLLRQLQQRGWPLAALDVGNQIKRFGRQSEIKLQIAVEGLKKMDYRAVGLGPDDLRLSTGELVAAFSDSPNRFVSANAVVLDPELTPKIQVIEAGGKRIGVTAVLGDEYRKRIASDEVAVRAASDGVKEASAMLKSKKCDLLVLLAHATLDESRQLARQFPEFQIVVTAGGAEEPAFEPEVVEKTATRLVQVGAKGMYVGVLGLFADARQPLRYQRVPLDDRFDDAAEMLALLSAYQDQLKQAGLGGLGLKPVPHPSKRQFVGSEKCGECHTKAMAVWEKTPHAHATQTLVKPGERSDIARHHDPECLSCHVTGWDAQKIFPYTSGYLGLKESPAMHGNGCENCHGPGSAHVAVESGEMKVSVALAAQYRDEMRLPLAQAEQKCMECHDLDNSPAFHKKGAFESYWKQVAHPGKD